MTARAGMTLLELVIALVVAATAMAAGYSALGSMVDHRARAVHATDAIARGAAVRWMLESWLIGARLTPEGSVTFRGLDGETMDHMPDDELTFLTTAPTPLGAAETVVHLSVERDSQPPNRGLVADLSVWNGLGARRVVIDSMATGLTLRYVTGVLGQRQAVPSWISSSVLPAGVILTLTAAHGDSLTDALRLPIVVPLRGGR